MIVFQKAPVVAGFTYLGDKTFSCDGNKNTIKMYRHEKTDLEFVLIPGGEFMMGSKGGTDVEVPVHGVTVKSFLLCRTECPQRAWDRIGGENARNFTGDESSHGECKLERLYGLV